MTNRLPFSAFNKILSQLGYEGRVRFSLTDVLSIVIGILAMLPPPKKSTGTVVVLRRDNPYLAYVQRSRKRRAKGWGFAGGWHEREESIGRTALRELWEEHPCFRGIVKTLQLFFVYTIVPIHSEEERKYDRKMSKFYEGSGLRRALMTILDKVVVRLGTDYDTVFVAFVDGDIEVEQGRSAEAKELRLVDLREVKPGDFAYHHGIIAKDVVAWVESNFTTLPDPLQPTPRIPDFARK